jgi:uncharacterized protein YdcH (DUF465 family)
MQAEMIDLLSGKWKFPTEQALVLAEAIDMAIEKTQFVTVPILDARFAAVDVRFAAVEARFAAIDARFTRIDARFNRIDARFDAVDARIARLEARMESGFVAVNARIDSLEVRMDAKMERWAVRMVIAMLVSQTALGPIGVGALDAVRRVLSTLVH